MTQPVIPQPLPVLQIISEAARLHWSHVLVFLAAAALYATPIMLAIWPIMVTLGSLGDNFNASPENLPPEIVLALAPRVGMTLLIGFPLSAALFAFWVRLTLIGPRAALLDQATGWPLRILRVTGVFLLAGVVAYIAMLTGTIMFGVLAPTNLSSYLIVFFMVAAIAFYFALFSRWLVESSLDIPRDSTTARAAIGIQAHLRLSALLSPLILGLLVIHALIRTVLVSMGAAVTALVGMGIFLTLVITAYASVHAIVYRLRTVPPLKAV